MPLMVKGKLAESKDVLGPGAKTRQPGVIFDSRGNPCGSSELFHVPGESQVV